MANTDVNITVISSEQAQLQASFDNGAVWQTLIGMTSFNIEDAPVDVRDTVPVAGRVGKRWGRPRVPKIAIQSYHLPQTKLYKDLQDLKNTQQLIKFRFMSFERELFDGSSGQAAISTNGVITFTGSDKPTADKDAIGVGTVIKHGTGSNVKAFTIREISSAGVITVDEPPSSALANGSYKLYIPSMQLGPFSAGVVTAGGFSLETEGEAMTLFEIQPIAQLPSWEVA